MRLYEFTDAAGNCATVGTMADAVPLLKAQRVCDRAACALRAIEVPTDRENILRLLNAKGGTHIFGRQWRGTRRGSWLEEVPTTPAVECDGSCHVKGEENL